MIREGQSLSDVPAPHQHRPEKAGAKLRRHAAQQRYHALLAARVGLPMEPIIP